MPQGLRPLAPDPAPAAALDQELVLPAGLDQRQLELFAQDRCELIELDLGG